MNHITLDKEYPVFFGGAALRRIYEAVDEKALLEIASRLIAITIAMGSKKKDADKLLPEVTDREIYLIFVPVVKWGIWGGYRFNNQEPESMDDDDIADLLAPKMAEGYKALAFFLEARNTNTNGQVKKKETETAGKH